MKRSAEERLQSEKREKDHQERLKTKEVYKNRFKSKNKKK